MTNGKHLLWLVERMIELRVPDTAVKSWSEQASFAADLQRAFRDDAWRNIAPSFPAVVLHCTSRLANVVPTGNILSARQASVRTECNVFDIIQGLEDLGMSTGFSDALEVGFNCAINSDVVTEIQRYVESAEETPFAQPVPHFPVVREWRLIPSFLQMRETPGF
ncbi:Hypothetical predicted protein [Olea europaea subsp. europaea]|uniref:Uncharacterized protein n=1 Tax=Olea europaea subsp. europaea TaxID=158383 RepID=A0A8S0TJ32_OLEEU|nr:Hypothetical predicted protein [Olea europaea subsp. europaea]